MSLASNAASRSQACAVTLASAYHAVPSPRSVPLPRGQAIAVSFEKRQRFVPSICKVLAMRPSKCQLKPEPGGDR